MVPGGGVEPPRAEARRILRRRRVLIRLENSRLYSISQELTNLDELNRSDRTGRQVDLTDTQVILVTESGSGLAEY